MVDQNTIPGDSAPPNQVDSVSGLNEPRQVSSLSSTSTAQDVLITPKITPTPPKPSWVTVCKNTTTNATRSSTSSKAVSTAGQSKAEMPITTRTDKTSVDFGKIFKKLEALEKKIDEKSHGEAVIGNGVTRPAAVGRPLDRGRRLGARVARRLEGC